MKWKSTCPACLCLSGALMAISGAQVAQLRAELALLKSSLKSSVQNSVSDSVSEIGHWKEAGEVDAFSPLIEQVELYSS